MNLFRSVRTPVLCAVPFLFASVLPLRAERTVRLFNRLELYSALSLRVPISSIRDESRSFTLYREPDGRRNGSPGWNCGSFEDAAGLCSLGSSDGIRLSFRDADFRLYGTLPPSAVAVLKTVRDAPALCRMLAAPRYGASVSFSHILPFALTVRAGSISPGGSWTRLSSPELYPSVSPFTGTYPLPEGLTASLPSSFSGGRLPAAAVCSEVPGSWKALKGSGISAFYRSDGMWAASGTCRAALPRMIRVCVSLTGGHFYLPALSAANGQGGGTGAGWIPAFCLQSQFLTPVFSSLLTVSAYGQPDSSVRYTFRTENIVNFRHFSLLASGFAADGTHIRCTDNSQIGTIGQIRFTPKYTLRFSSPRLPSLTAGASCMFQYCFDKKKDSAYGSMKYSFGSQYSDTNVAASVSFSSDGILLTGAASAVIPEYTVTARCSLSGGRFRTAASAVCAFSGTDTQQTYRISAGTQTRSVCASGTAALSYQQKASDWNGGSASAGMTCTVLSRFVKYTFRLALSAVF